MNRRALKLHKEKQKLKNEIECFDDMHQQSDDIAETVFDQHELHKSHILINCGNALAANFRFDLFFINATAENDPRNQC